MAVGWSNVLQWLLERVKKTLAEVLILPGHAIQMQSWVLAGKWRHSGSESCQHLAMFSLQDKQQWCPERI